MNTSVRYIVEELQKRDIHPDILELPNGGTLLNFFYAGSFRFISGVSPDLSASTGRTISNDKYIAHILATKLGISSPETILYTDTQVAKAFLKKHARVVVKPLDGAHGDGITTNVTNEKELTMALEKATKVSASVLLQEYVEGDDYRVLVIDGEVVAASLRTPAAVTGDGVHTIRELIDHENKTNQLRGSNYTKPQNYIDVRAAELYLGKVINSIPEKGEPVNVVGTANIGTGGAAENKTSELPPSLKIESARFAKATGLFICGVDFLYDTVKGKWYFIEVNSSPSFGLHVSPLKGDSIDVHKVFVERLLKAYENTEVREVVGRNAAVDIIGYASGIPAKIDTGADGSSIWASGITVDESGHLKFCLFDQNSPHYTGDVITVDTYKAALVRSSSGHEQVRYRASFSVRVNGKRIKATFNLSDRSRNNFPILIGRRTLSNKFLVDVSKAHYDDDSKGVTIGLNEELMKDPRAFYEKYYGKDLD